jgi:hypothetical protein
MGDDPIPELVKQVDMQQIRDNLFYLAEDPLPCRRANYVLSGHEKNTLYEADDYIQSLLESWGYTMEKEVCLAQASRRDPTKQPRHRQATDALPGDPWYEIYNLYAKKVGTAHPEEIVIVISHKDSHPALHTPGAYDNATGTVTNLEIARVLSNYPTRRSIWFIYCNEEHRPWSSKTAARRARQRGDNIVAVFNLDGTGGKTQADIDAGRKVNVAHYVRDESKWLADLMAEVNDTYEIGLIQTAAQTESAGSDDQSYIDRGYLSAINNIGSIPFRPPHYHEEGDIPGRVDVENVTMVAKATVAAVVRVADRLAP